MPDPIRRRYLELVKRSLLNELHPELEAQVLHTVLCVAHRQPVDLEALQAARGNSALLGAIRTARSGGDTLVLRGVDDSGAIVDRLDLRNHTEFAHTMIGRARLDHLHECVETVLAENVRGDLFEAGVWRGGACVLMAAVLAAHGVTDRAVWAADSFRGVPPPTLAEDEGLDLSASVLPVLSVDEASVRELFARYELLSDQVRFVSGWFSESLPRCPVGELAVLRIDGDLFESTRDVLENLYPKLSPGGYVIVDDYAILEPCRRAVTEFRQTHGVGETLHRIDGHAVYWRRTH